MNKKLLDELRGNSPEELEALFGETKKELFQLRNEVRETKKGVEKPHLFGEYRKKMARIKTVLREKRGN